MIARQAEEAKKMREEMLALLRAGKALEHHEITASIFRITDIQLQMLFQVAEQNDTIKRSLDELRSARKESQRAIAEVVESERKRQMSPFFIKVALGVLSLLATVASSVSGYVLSQLNENTHATIVLNEKIQAVDGRQSTTEEQVRFILRREQR